MTIEIDPAEVGPGASATIIARTHVAAVAEPQAHWALIDVARFDVHGLVAESRQFRLNLEYTADLLLLVEPDRDWFVGTIGVPELRTFYLRSSGLDAIGLRNLRVEGEGFALDRVRRFRSMPEHRAPEDVLAVTVSYAGRSSESWQARSDLKRSCPAWRRAGCGWKHEPGRIGGHGPRGSR